jgi:hypothetical protein
MPLDMRLRGSDGRGNVGGLGVGCLDTDAGCAGVGGRLVCLRSLVMIPTAGSLL